LGAAGIFVAGFLSYATWQQLEVPCGGQMGCNLVQQSIFAKFPAEHGVPVAYLGLLGYVALFAFAIVRSIYTGRTHRKLAILGFVFSAVGMLFSLYLTYASLALLKLSCVWCLTSLFIILATTITHAALIQGETPERQDSKFGLGVAAVTFILAMGSIAVWTAKLNRQIEFAVELVNPGNFSVMEALPRREKVIGGEEAVVTVIEFADFNCPACRSSYPNVRQVLGRYGDRVRFAYRHFPLIGKVGHETSLEAALFSEYAADKGKFWDYVDEVMKESNKERIKALDGLIAVAVESGLNRSDLVATFNSPEKEFKDLSDMYFERVNDDIRLGEDMAVATTPTLVIYAEGQKPKAVAHTRLEIELESSPYRELLQRK
jgi:uncharacterized membrane protein/predicted DsbA family dithiol-disulfide isomerase